MNYLEILFKQVKLNIEWCLLPLGYIPITEEKELNKMLESRCPSIVPTNNLTKEI